MFNIQLKRKKKKTALCLACLLASCKIYHLFLRLNWSFLSQVIVLITRREDGGTMHVPIQISTEFGIVEDTTAVDTRMVFTGLNSGGDHIH